MNCDKKMSIYILLIIFLSMLTLNSAFGARLSGDKEITEKKLQTSPPVPQGNKNSSSSKIRENRTSANQKETSYFNLDFEDTDIKLFIKFISELTGKNFVVDNGVKGKITIVSPTKISVDEAYKVFESVLEVHGFTTVPSGNIIKIIPALEARSKDIDTIIQKEESPEDKVVTQLIPLKYANPDEIKKIFGAFVSKSGVIISYEPTGTLIVTDVLSNITRLLEIIEAIDVPGTGEIISVIPLDNASAEVIANSLSSVFRTVTRTGRKTQDTSQIAIVPDKRTNTLIVLASEVDTLKIKELLKLLDKEIPRGEGDIHVYYLQNADAEELSKTLMNIPSKQGPADQKGTAPVLSKDIQIVADKSTNSLIITAKKDEYSILEDVILKLDISRKMVYIEALTMEVSMSKQFDLGVQWIGGSPAGYLNDRPINVFSSSNPGANILPSADQDGIANVPPGFSLGIIGDTIEIGGITFPSIGAVVRAFASNSDVQIHSIPQVMVENNEEAELKVADNIPFLTRKDTSNTGNVDYSNYEFKDVGVTLKITPQINQEKNVRLKIDQKVDQVVNQEEVGLPTTLVRQLKTTVGIKDGQTVVLGGLIDETDNKTNYKVPILGRIPILGNLFKSQTNSNVKKNLYTFITVHIFNNSNEATSIYEDKKGHIDTIKEGAIKTYQGRRDTKDTRLANLGYKYLQLGEYDRALEYCREALEINPENPYAILNSGYIYQMRGETEKAKEFYKRLIELDPPERANFSTNPMLSGKKLTDIAKENLKNLNDNETDR
jgi:general secretion pathway protein D